MLRKLFAGGCVLALAYLVYLRRELAIARQRGDMYREIAAQLDQQRAPSSV